MPQSTFHNCGKDKLPLLEILRVGFDWVIVVFGGQTLTNVITINHISSIECYYQRAALGRF